MISISIISNALVSLIATGSIPDQAAPALAACTVAGMSGHMPRELPKSTSDDSHLAGDTQHSENKDFAGMAVEVTEGTSDDTHLADDSKRQENAAGFSGYAPPVQEDGDSKQSENRIVKLEEDAVPDYVQVCFLPAPADRRHGVEDQRWNMEDRARDKIGPLSMGAG